MRDYAYYLVSFQGLVMYSTMKRQGRRNIITLGTLRQTQLEQENFDGWDEVNTSIKKMWEYTPLKFASSETAGRKSHA